MLQDIAFLQAWLVKTDFVCNLSGKRLMHCVDKLSQTAVKATMQAAFASLTESLQCEWNFLQRVVPDCAAAFKPLSEKIKKQFFLGGDVTEAEEALFVLPTSLAGLGIFDPHQDCISSLPDI